MPAKKQKVGAGAAGPRRSARVAFAGLKAHDTSVTRAEKPVARGVTRVEQPAGRMEGIQGPLLPKIEQSPPPSNEGRKRKIEEDEPMPPRRSVRLGSSEAGPSRTPQSNAVKQEPLAEEIEVQTPPRKKRMGRKSAQAGSRRRVEFQTPHTARKSAQAGSARSFEMEHLQVEPPRTEAAVQISRPETAVQIARKRKVIDEDAEPIARKSPKLRRVAGPENTSREVVATAGPLVAPQQVFQQGNNNNQAQSPPLEQPRTPADINRLLEQIIGHAHRHAIATQAPRDTFIDVILAGGQFALGLQHMGVLDFTPAFVSPDLVWPPQAQFPGASSSRPIPVPPQRVTFNAPAAPSPPRYAMRGALSAGTRIVKRSIGIARRQEVETNTPGLGALLWSRARQISRQASRGLRSAAIYGLVLATGAAMATGMAYYSYTRRPQPVRRFCRSTYNVERM